MNIPFAGTLLGWAARHFGCVELLSSFQQASVQRALLVLTTGIGDAIFSTATFDSVRKAFPKADIRLFCRAGWSELFADDPRINDVIPYFGKFRRWVRTITCLRTFAPDVVIILHGNDPDILPLCALSGARHVVRIPTGGTRYPELLSNRERAEDANPLPNIHYVDNRVRILDTLGIPVLSRTPEMHLSLERKNRVAAELRERFQGRPYWVLHLHAANTYKSLPLAQAKELITAALQKFPALDVVLSGGAKDRLELCSLLPPDAAKRVWVAAGVLSLADMAACLAGAQLVLAPDTGILHLAAALDRRVIGLFSPTSPDSVGPRATTAPVTALSQPQTCSPCSQKKCPYRPATCMTQFSANVLIPAMEKML